MKDRPFVLYGRTSIKPLRFPLKGVAQPSWKELRPAAAESADRLRAATTAAGRRQNGLDLRGQPR